MRISHEAIYQALYIQGRGSLKRELVSYLCICRARMAMGTFPERRMAPRSRVTVPSRWPMRSRRQSPRCPLTIWQSLTWDRGKELSDHARFTVESGVKVFFADPHSPWQRGTNENTNGLLRQYFPKGTDLSRWGAEALQAVAHTLNTRPRKTLGWRTPAEALNAYLQSIQQSSVATTG